MTTKDLTIEELEKQYAEITERYNTIGEQLRKKKQDEADRKKAQLALEQEKRKEEVDAALDQYHELLKAYIKDYGRYSNKKTNNELVDVFWWF